MPKQYQQACPVAKSVELLGERWTLLVVRDLLSRPRRFGDLQESLPGIAPNVLSARLQTLEEHGIVTRRFYSEHPPRAEYLLTERGRELGSGGGRPCRLGISSPAPADHAGAHRLPDPARGRLLLPALPRQGARQPGQAQANGRSPAWHPTFSLGHGPIPRRWPRRPSAPRA